MDKNKNNYLKRKEEISSILCDVLYSLSSSSGKRLLTIEKCEEVAECMIQDLITSGCLYDKDSAIDKGDVFIMLMDFALLCRKYPNKDIVNYATEFMHG